MTLIKIVLLAAPLFCALGAFVLNRTQLAEAKSKDEHKQGRRIGV
jgi:hypothetical protein